MPCESCNVQFTVFKRKRLCSECRRFYCSHCLVKRSDKILCERCIILTARPLSKIDLLKLKPKDLIFYLQSKHISTTGCVEKEELVNLVINHVNSTATDRTSQSSNAPTPQHASSGQTPATGDYENCSNPFDQIKQTCQSLFSSFAEKIVDLNFENKPASNAPNNNQPANIFNQPRFQTREMPTYASRTHIHNVQPQNPEINSSMPRSSSSTSDLSNVNRTAAQSQYASSSNPSSPIISMSSISSHGSTAHQLHPSANVRSDPKEHSTIKIATVHKGNMKRFIDNLQDGSGCECSDDEVLAEFAHRHKTRPVNQQPVNTYVEKLSPPSQTDSAFEDQIPGPSGSGAQSGSPSKLSSGDNQRSSEESSGSSFEELGAVGGANEWQIVDKVDVMQVAPNESGPVSQQPNLLTITPSTSSANTTFQVHSNVTSADTENRKPSHKPRRLNRRRSDSCVVQTNSNRQQQETSFCTQMEDDESDDPTHEDPSCKRVRKCCRKCGKTKNSLKSKLLKFRRELETKRMSEGEMKREIEEFIIYLEKKSRESFDCSDSELNVASSSVEPRMSAMQNVHLVTIEDTSADDDGIHVYGSRAEESYGGGPWRHDGRFLNLSDFKSSSELDELSVKQLKEILMLNRVDYKGCCEKQELLDRVNRLWTDLQTSPAIDKLPTDDLCKICMDAPIECVILECGHMATCTNCGKVLSECPICRQYIVRVVRFFRA